MGKAKSEATPLWITLKEAIGDAQIISDKGAGSLSRDELARAKGSSSKSSAYRMGLVALRAYGLIQSGTENLELTLLARSIVTPVSDSEREDAIFKSFEAVAIFKALHAKYKGGYLPEDTYLSNYIHKEFGASQEHATKWTSNFIESGVIAGILSRDGSKIRVLSAPDLKPKDRIKDKGEENPKPPSEGAGDEEADVPQIPKTNVPFYLPTGTNRIATIPQDLTEKDLQYLITVIGAFIKSRG